MQPDLDEARGVAGGGLDAACEDREAVRRRRGGGRDRGERAIAGVAHAACGARGVDLVARREVRMLGEELAALRERLRVRDHGAEVGERDAGQREQAVLDRADHLAGDVKLAVGEEVVRLVDRAGGRVLDRQEREIGAAREHGVGRGAERVEAVEQRAALAPAVAALRGEVRVRALDALVRDAQRGIGARADRLLLVRDRQLHDEAVDALDRVRVEPGLERVLAQPHEQGPLALAIAQRARRGELGERDVLDDAQPIGEQRDDLAVDLVDAVAERRDGRQIHRYYVQSGVADDKSRDGKPELIRKGARQDLEVPPDEPPVVARMIVEIRSDGSRTIARGAVEDVATGARTTIEARGDSPMQLALALAKSLGTLPQLTLRSAVRGLLSRRKKR